MKTALLLATVYLALLAVAADLKEDTLLNWKRSGNDDKKSHESDEKGSDDKSEKSLEWWNKKGDSKEESVSLIDGSPEKGGVIDLKDGKEKDKCVWVLKDDKGPIPPIDKLPVDVDIQDILDWKNDKKEVKLKPIKVEISIINKLCKKDEKIDGVWDLNKGEIILLPKKGKDSHEDLACKNDLKYIDWQLIKMKIPKIDKLTKKDEEVGGVWDLKKEVILLPKKGTDVRDILDWESDKKCINWLPIKVIIPKIDFLTDLKNGKVSKEILSDELKLHNVQRRDTRQIWDLKYGKGHEGIGEGVWKHGKGNPGDVEHKKKDKEIRKLREWQKKQEKKIWEDHWKSKDWKKGKDLRNPWYVKEKRRKPWNADWI